MAKSDEPVTIKKYANRRLYNTGTSTYVTLEDLATMVKAGEDFVVYDAKTGEDITRSVLAQIIFEQENKEGQNLLPINFLRQLIRFYGDSMQMLVPRYLEVSIDSLTREQEKFRQQMAQAFGGIGSFGPLEDQVRRNMEMFERAFAMFTPFAQARGAGRRSRQAAARRGGSRRRRRDRRSQAPDGRDAEAARPPGQQGMKVSSRGLIRQAQARRRNGALAFSHGRSGEASPTSAPCMIVAAPVRRASRRPLRPAPIRPRSRGRAGARGRSACARRRGRPPSA